MAGENNPQMYNSGTVADPSSIDKTVEKVL